MHLVQKNKWQPSAALSVLHQRAAILRQIREFFYSRDVLEVDTPLLSRSTVTDPYVNGIAVESSGLKFYLQTSPEYAMKRLLAAGSGSLFQICKAFRANDQGQLHNPEFSILEWYRIGFDHHALMDEMDELLQIVLKMGKAERFTIQDIYEKELNINPHTATQKELAACVKKHIDLESPVADIQTYLDLLFTHCIAPRLSKTRPVFLYDFPYFQAALAKIRPGNPPLASRFEVYVKGVELANGFHELADSQEQRTRFENDLSFRKTQQLPLVPIDEYFLSALEKGLPDCAGVAVGIDRLIMLALEKDSISDVLSFDIERA